MSNRVVLPSCLFLIQPWSMAASSIPYATRRRLWHAGEFGSIASMRLLEVGELLQGVLLQLLKTRQRQVCLLSCILPAMLVTLMPRGLPHCRLCPGVPYGLQ